MTPTNTGEVTTTQVGHTHGIDWSGRKWGRWPRKRKTKKLGINDKDVDK